MKLKAVLAYIITEIRYDHRLRYRDLIKLDRSCLSTSQVTNILNHDGKDVDIERMYSLIDDLGYKLKITQVRK